MEQDQVSRTALEVARTRRELKRPGDGSMGADAEKRFLATLGEGRPSAIRPYLVSRTSFFDGCVMAAQRDGFPQIALVGAGFDGRALRFRASGTAFFELDHPATQADKLARLTSLEIDVSDIRFGGLDFAADDAGPVLAALGHRAELQTLFLCEGVAGYLTEPVLRRLFSSLRGRAAPGSALAVSFAISTTDPELEARQVRWEQRLARLGEEPRTRLARKEVERLLRGEGWQPSDMVTPANPEFGGRPSGALFVRAVAPAP